MEERLAGHRERGGSPDKLALQSLRRRSMAMRINHNIAQHAIKPGKHFLIVADGLARGERFEVGGLEQILCLGTIAKMSCQKREELGFGLDEERRASLLIRCIRLIDVACV